MSNRNNELEVNQIKNADNEREKNIYSKASAEIQSWPTWKKEEYNSTFAVSNNAKKLVLN